MKTIVSIADAIKDGNSTANQKIKGKFIGREVYCNVTTLVEYCLSKGFEDLDSPVNLDEIENYYNYPEYRGEYANFDGGGENDINDEIERLRDLQSRDETEAKRNRIEDEINELANLEIEPSEIYEWWAVSPFLFEKLKAEGCTVVDTGSCYVWGRQTTGQAILLDGVITRICAKMEILDGQANSWANHAN